MNKTYMTVVVDLDRERRIVCVGDSDSCLDAKAEWEQDVETFYAFVTPATDPRGEKS